MKIFTQAQIRRLKKQVTKEKTRLFDAWDVESQTFTTIDAKSGVERWAMKEKNVETLKRRAVRLLVVDYRLKSLTAVLVNEKIERLSLKA